MVSVRPVAWPKRRQKCGSSSQISCRSGGFLADTKYLMELMLFNSKSRSTCTDFCEEPKMISFGGTPAGSLQFASTRTVVPVVRTGDHFDRTGRTRLPSLLPSALSLESAAKSGRPGTTRRTRASLQGSRHSPQRRGQPHSGGARLRRGSGSPLGRDVCRRASRLSDRQRPRSRLDLRRPGQARLRQ